MKKRKSFAVVGFILLLVSLRLWAVSNPTPLEGNGPRYRLKMNFSVKSWGRLALLIPYKAYLEVNGDLFLRVYKDGEKGERFLFDGIGEPGIYMQTIDFIPSEVHVRAASNSIEESVRYGKERLESWKAVNGFFCEKVPPKGFKALPFLFKKGNGKFTFLRDREGLFPEESVENSLDLYYPWPSKSKFSVPAYKMLAAALTFFNTPFKGAEGESSYKVININLNRPMNKVLKYTVPAVQKFVQLKQRRLFAVDFLVTREGSWTIYEGESFPEVTVWGGFSIKEYRRRVVMDPKTLELKEDRIYFKILDDKGHGGEGRLELIREDEGTFASADGVHSSLSGR